MPRAHRQKGCHSRRNRRQVRGIASDVLLQGQSSWRSVRRGDRAGLVCMTPIGGDVARGAGEQALMRGLVTACPCVHPGPVLSYNGRRQCRPQSAAGNFPFNATSPPMGAVLWFGSGSGPCLFSIHPGNHPHKGRKFAGNGGNGDRAALAATGGRRVALGQTGLYLPRDVAHRFRHVSTFVVFLHANLCRKAIGPGVSASTRRTRALPVMVMLPRRMESRVDRSDGTRPRWPSS